MLRCVTAVRTGNVADHSLTACQSSTSFGSRAHHPESRRPLVNTNHAICSTHLIYTPRAPGFSRLNGNLSLCVSLPSHIASCTRFYLYDHAQHTSIHTRVSILIPPHAGPDPSRPSTRIQRSALDRHHYCTNTTKEKQIMESTPELCRTRNP